MTLRMAHNTYHWTSHKNTDSLKRELLYEHLWFHPQLQGLRHIAGNSRQDENIIRYIVSLFQYYLHYKEFIFGDEGFTFAEQWLWVRAIATGGMLQMAMRIIYIWWRLFIACGMQICGRSDSPWMSIQQNGDDWCFNQRLLLFWWALGFKTEIIRCPDALLIFEQFEQIRTDLNKFKYIRINSDNLGCIRTNNLPNSLEIVRIRSKMSKFARDCPNSRSNLFEIFLKLSE